MLTFELSAAMFSGVLADVIRELPFFEILTPSRDKEKFLLLSSPLCPVTATLLPTCLYLSLLSAAQVVKTQKSDVGCPFPGAFSLPAQSFLSLPA